MELKNNLAQMFIYVNGMFHRLGNFHHRGQDRGVNPQQGQGRVLAILKLQPEITQKELGYLLDMRNQSLGELLGKLEKKGYITRTKSEADRRTTNIRLTQSGRKAAEETERHRDEWEYLFEGLSHEEQKQLYILLVKLAKDLQKKYEEADGRPPRGFGYFGGRQGFGHDGEQRPFDNMHFGDFGPGGQWPFSDIDGNFDPNDPNKENE